MDETDAKKRNFGIRRQWTQEETEKLIQLSENYTKSDIAKRLHRTPSSVNGKIQALQLGGLIDRTAKWNFKQIADAVGVDPGCVGKTWVKYGLKYVKRGYYCLVDETELHRFMREHPELWNATKCDYYLFYQFSWFMDKLEQDKKVPVEHRGYFWTDYQKQQFASLKRKGYTHKQIADAIGKSKKAVDHYSMRVGKENKHERIV